MRKGRSAAKEHLDHLSVIGHVNAVLVLDLILLYGLINAFHSKIKDVGEITVFGPLLGRIRSSVVEKTYFVSLKLQVLTPDITGYKGSCLVRVGESH